MNVIFLDVDGVLNNDRLIRKNGFYYIDPGMVERLALAVGQTGARIVLSSSWRLDPKSSGMVDAALRESGVFVHGKTSKIRGPRAKEIADWIDRNTQVESYAILDDDEDAGIGMEHSFFRTSPKLGLTYDIVSRVILHLNGG